MSGISTTTCPTTITTMRVAALRRVPETLTDHLLQSPSALETLGRGLLPVLSPLMSQQAGGPSRSRVSQVSHTISSTHAPQPFNPPWYPPFPMYGPPSLFHTPWLVVFLTVSKTSLIMAPYTPAKVLEIQGVPHTYHPLRRTEGGCWHQDPHRWLMRLTPGSAYINDAYKMSGGLHVYLCRGTN